MTLEDLYRLLRSGHVQTQGIVDTLREPLVVLDQGFCVLSCNPAFYETFKVERDAVVGQNFFDLGNGQWNIPTLRQLLALVVPKSTAVVDYEINHEFPFIGRRTMLISARRLVHPDNNSTSMLVVFEDVTDNRRVEVEKDILLAETRHRMKNLLAVVRALASQTQIEDRSAKEYRDAFLGRFEAVLNAQDLSFSGVTGADLAVLVTKALGPTGASRVRVEAGPAVQLAGGQVLPVSMILHELMTNALKYGALSIPQGVVHVSWRTVAQGDQNTLRLDWREEHGPPVTPPGRSGFGTRLIEFSAGSDLGGGAELCFESGGFQARISVPLG
jgi:two-component sensor histidine kinase